MRIRGHSQIMLPRFCPLLTTYSWPLWRNYFTVIWENLYTVDISSTYHLPTSSCQLSLWTPPTASWGCWKHAFGIPGVLPKDIPSINGTGLTYVFESRIAQGIQSLSSTIFLKNCFRCKTIIQFVKWFSILFISVNINA